MDLSSDKRKASADLAVSLDVEIASRCVPRQEICDCKCRVVETSAQPEQEFIHGESGLDGFTMGFVCHATHRIAYSFAVFSVAML